MAYRSVWRLIGVSLDLNMKARSHNVCCLIQPDFISANIMLLYCALCTVRLVLRAVGRGAKSMMSLKQLWESSHSSHSIARESSRNITCSERMMARLTPCSNIALSSSEGWSIGTKWKREFYDTQNKVFAIFQTAITDKHWEETTLQEFK